MVDKWRSPLLETKLLNVPEGANMAFTDSIPLAVLVLKPFRHWLLTISGPGMRLPI